METNCYETLSAQVARLNQFVEDGVLRRYQLRVLQSGTIQISMPSGRTTSHSSICLPGHEVGYRFNCDEWGPIWLISGRLAEGFPLVSCYSVTSDDFVALSDSFRVQELKLDRLRSLLVNAERHLAAGIGSTGTSSVAPIILFGDRNFAHQIWNEFPAAVVASRILGPSRAAEIQLTMLYEPIERLGDLLHPFRVTGPSSAPAVGELFVGSLLVRLGSVLVTREARSLLSQVLQVTPDPTAEILEERDPILWLSVRTDKRACENIEEFLQNFIIGVARVYPGAGFVLDGFSYPDDFEANAGYLPTADAFKARASESGKLISRLISSLDELNLGSRIFSSNGLNLSMVLRAAARSSYYVCHSGTMQHKVGWVYDSRGFIHFPPAGNFGAVRRWHGFMVEDGRIPAGVAPDEVVLGELGQADMPHNSRYRITDTNALTLRILEDAFEELQSRASSEEDLS